jgi:TolB-like protein
MNRILVVCLVALGGLSIHSPARGESLSLAVMEFTSKGGVTQDQMDALSDMLVNELRKTGDHKVIDKATIRSLLNLEEQKNLLKTCADQNCMADLGGALGVQYMVAGNVSLFGKTYLLNLKIIDVKKAQIAHGVSHNITGGEDQLLADLPKAAKELLAGALGQPLPVTAPSDQGISSEASKAEPSAETKTEWFLAPKDRTGRWNFRISAGSVFFSDVRIAGTDAFTLHNIRDFGNKRNGPIFNVSTGYGLLKWLEVSFLLQGFVADDVDGDWTHRGIEAAAELRASWPLDSWFEPHVYLALGYSRLDDICNDCILSGKMVGNGFMSATGLGANVYFTRMWFFGLQAGWEFRSYKNLHLDGNLFSATVTINGGRVVLLSGWNF